MIDLAESLVFGGGHGIGLALVQRLQEISPQNKTVVSYRNKEAAQELFGLAKKNRNILIHPLDPIKEESLKTFFAWASQNSSSQLNLSICCIGALASQGKRPERALKDLDAETMLESFSTNCVAHALILKHLKALIPRSNPFVLAHLSARVGSLEDNSLGGWHSYRMSKAALNMLVKNAAIELKRDSYQTIAISLHHYGQKFLRFL